MKSYYCPMCTGVASDKSGTCPNCGMDLIKNNSDGSAEKAAITDQADSLLPLGIIVGLIILVSTVATFTAPHTHDGSSFHHFMRVFMAGFFIVFAGFKLLDIKGFAQGYSMYDLLAKRWRGYGYIYPFIELSLGLAYLADFQPVFAHTATLVIMAFNALGARIALQRNGKLRCACLGTMLKLPLTYITVTESVTMAGMAALMLLGF